MTCVCIKVGLEIRNGYTVRMLVIYSQTTAYIDILHLDVMPFQFILQIIDTIAESLEVTHVKYLRTNMKVKSDKLDVLHLGCFLYSTFHITHGDTEFIFSETGRDVGMRVRTYIRINAERHRSCLVHLTCYLIDHFQFCYTLDIKTENVLFQSQLDFPVTLADTRIYDFARWETCVGGCFYFTAADTVGT